MFFPACLAALATDLVNLLAVVFEQEEKAGGDMPP